jgi:hypothetical protein
MTLRDRARARSVGFGEANAIPDVLDTTGLEIVDEIKSGGINNIDPGSWLASEAGVILTAMPTCSKCSNDRMKWANLSPRMLEDNLLKRCVTEHPARTLQLTTQHSLFLDSRIEI